MRLSKENTSLLLSITSTITALLAILFTYMSYKSQQEAILFSVSGISGVSFAPLEQIALEVDFFVANGSQSHLTITSLSCNNLSAQDDYRVSTSAPRAGFRPCEILTDLRLPKYLGPGEGIKITAKAGFEGDKAVVQKMREYQKNGGDDVMLFLLDILKRDYIDYFGNTYDMSDSRGDPGTSIGIGQGDTMFLRRSVPQGFVFYVETARRSQFSSQHFQVRLGGPGF